jgi:hypothetical protein
MTIEIVRQYEEACTAPVMRAAAKAANKEMGSFNTYRQKQENQETRLDAAAIRRWAKELSISVKNHRKPWIFIAKSGEKIAMSPGRFAWKDGVLEQVVVKRVGK